MHATRDTNDVIKRNLVGGRVMRSVSLLPECEKGELMSRRSFVVLALAVGAVVGFALNHTTNSQSVRAQESERLLVQGHGRAISSLTPPGEQFTLTASNAPRRPCEVIPAGKKLVLTDVMYLAQGSVRQDVAVNLGDANPANQTHSILFQVKISPGESDEVHLCSGYVIPSGHALVAFTNAAIEPGQYVSVSATGYLADE